jgi:D-3-phosphoglycerate dehydrogenase
MIGAAEIAAMRPRRHPDQQRARTVVDLDALAAALRSGHLLGAAVDVFPEEPARNGEPFAPPCQGIPNVILTPHIGGSTAEAQTRIGEEVARKLIDYSDTGATMGAVNFPQVQLPPRPSGARWMHMHRDAPGMLSRINEIFGRRGPQHRRAVLPDGRRAGLCGGGQRGRRGGGREHPGRAARPARDGAGAADLRPGV